MVSRRGPFSFAAVVALVGCCGACSFDESDDENEGNVSFSTNCSIPTPCGGDPTGEWNVAGGCVQPSTEDYDCNWRDSASGDVSGTVSFVDGSFSMELEAELLHCDAIDLGSRSLGGTYRIMGVEIIADSMVFGFCVDGDTLLLSDRVATSPDMTVLVLARKGS